MHSVQCKASYPDVLNDIVIFKVTFTQIQSIQVNKFIELFNDLFREFDDSKKIYVSSLIMFTENTRSDFLRGQQNTLY